MRLMDYSESKPDFFWMLISALGLGTTALHGIIWYILFPTSGRPDVVENLVNVLPYLVGLLIFIFIGSVMTMYVAT